MAKLGSTTVLDPACGSGNFLYVALRAMKDLEQRARDLFAPLNLDFKDIVSPRQFYISAPSTGRSGLQPLRHFVAPQVIYTCPKNQPPSKAFFEVSF